MAAAYDKLLVDPDPKLAEQGWRLRVTRGEDEGNVLVERERVLPEKVGAPEANNVFEHESFGWMNKPEMVWLRDRLTELIDTDESEATPS